MSTLTTLQSQRLAELAHLIRKDWDVPGIAAAIRNAAKAPAAEVASALFALAADPNVKTPALLPQRGHWWPTGEAMSGPAVSYNVPCPEHASQIMPCRECANQVTPAPPGFAAEVRASLAAVPRTNQQRKAIREEAS